jgi:tetratricopeptide (TPR) repeat protein
MKVKLAQKQVLREGNDLYKEKKFDEAEIRYKKALEENPSYEKANFNLANAIYQQKRFKEALPSYELVAKVGKDKNTRAEAFHNMGNVFLNEKQLDKAIAAYKDALRINPKDEETRYNLALAQKMLEDQKNSENKDQKDDKNKDKQDENKEQDKDKKDQDQDKNKDEGDEKDKDKEQDKGDQKDDKKDQENGGQDDKKEQEQQKPQPNQLSDQQIQQLLEAMNNEENKTQQKVNAKKARGRKVNQEKDW